MSKQITAYRITAGSFRRIYHTEYHAEQMARALRGNGMSPTVEPIKLPNDALTRLSVA